MTTLTRGSLNLTFGTESLVASLFTLGITETTVGATATGVVATLTSLIPNVVFSEYTDVPNVSVAADGAVSLATALGSLGTRVVNAQATGTISGVQVTLRSSFVLSAVGAGGGPDVTSPVIISSGTGSFNENAPLSVTLAANESAIFSKRTGADSALFTLSGASNEILSIPQQNYEDGKYTFIANLRATDTSGNVTDFVYTATLLNVQEIALGGVLFTPVAGLVGVQPAGTVLANAGTGRVTGDDLLLGGAASSSQGAVFNSAKTAIVAGVGGFIITSSFQVTQTHPDSPTSPVTTGTIVVGVATPQPTFTTTPYSFAGKVNFMGQDATTDSYVTGVAGTAYNVQDGYLDLLSSFSVRSFVGEDWIVSRWDESNATSLNSSWGLLISGGFPQFVKFGTDGTFASATASVSMSTLISPSDIVANRRIWLRARVNASGSVKNTIASGAVSFEHSFDGTTFYAFPGTVVYKENTTTVAGLPPTGMITIGAQNGFCCGTIGTNHQFNGRIYQAIGRRTDGSIMFNCDYSTLAIGQKGLFNDNASTPNSWVINGPITCDMTPLPSVYPRLGQPGVGKLKIMELLPKPPSTSEWGSSWANYNSPDMLDRIQWSKSKGANAIKVTSTGCIPVYPTPSAMEPIIQNFCGHLRNEGLYLYLSVGHADEISGPSGNDRVALGALNKAHCELWMKHGKDLILAVDVCNEIQFARPSTWSGTAPNAVMFADLAHRHAIVREVMPDVPMSVSSYVNNRAELGTSPWIRAQAVLGMDFHDIHPYNGQNNTVNANIGQAPAAVDIDALVARTTCLGGKILIGEWGIIRVNSDSVKTTFYNGIIAQAAHASVYGWVAFGDVDYTGTTEDGRYGIRADTTLTALFASGAAGTISTTTDSTGPSVTSASTGSVNENAMYTHTVTASEAFTLSIRPGLDGALWTVTGANLILPGQNYDAVPSKLNYAVSYRLTDSSGNFTDATHTVTLVNQLDTAISGVVFTPVTGLVGTQPAGTVLATHDGTTNRITGDNLVLGGALATGGAVFNTQKTAIVAGSSGFSASAGFTVTHSHPDAATSPVTSGTVSLGSVATVIPATQTVKFGSLTLVGHGGHNLAYTGTGFLGLSGTNSTHFAIDDEKKLVPKNGANAYGTSPPAWASPYTLTVTEYSDSGLTTTTGRTSTVTVVIDSTQGYTVAAKAGSNADTTGAFQLRTALNLCTTVTQRITIRDGTIINPAGLNYSVRRASQLTGFTGSNHLIITPETPKGAIIRRLSMDGQQNTSGVARLNYLRYKDIVFELTKAQYTDSTSFDQVNCLMAGTGGASYIKIDGCEFRSTPNSLFGDDQCNAVFGGTGSYKGGHWEVTDNVITDINKGVYLGNPDQLYDSAGAALPTGASDYSDPTLVEHTVSRNVFRRIASDEISIANGTGGFVEDNFFYDKITSVKPYPGTAGATDTTANSPYDTGVQPHGDGIQYDYSSMLFGSVKGPVIRRNIWTRGVGRDTMPFYTSPPYTNPDNKGNVPNPNMPYPDSQGIFISNGGRDKTIRGGNGTSGGYPCTIKSPIIQNNCYMRVFARGISISNCENPIIENNTVLAEKSVPLSPNADQAGAIYVTEISGSTGRVRRNVSRTVSLSYDDVTGGSLADITNNVSHDYAASSGVGAYGTLFSAPVFGGAVTSAAIFQNAFRPKTGSALILSGGLYAGALDTSGAFVTVESAGPSVSGTLAPAVIGQPYDSSLTVSPAGSPVTLGAGEAAALTSHNITHDGFGRFTSGSVT